MSAKSFAATGAATTAAAVIGGAATDVDSHWYRGLALPDWQPPGQVIGQIWTVLYILIAIATGRAWNRAEPRRRRRLATVLGINLCLNAAWPWVFFRAHRPALGSAVIGSQGASPATAVTSGCPASTTGMRPKRPDSPSSSSFRSWTGEASGPFQPRTRNRGRQTTAPVPRSACRIAAATGIIRSTLG